MSTDQLITVSQNRIGSRQFFEKYGMICVMVLFSITLAIANPTFLTFGNLQNLTRQIAVNGVIAMGMTAVILTGGIDLSVGSLVAVAGVVAAKYMEGNPDGSVVWAFVLPILVCAAFGAIYGSIIAWTGLPPFVVTLAVMQITRGLALAYADGKPIMIKNPVFRSLGQGKFLDAIPIPIIVLIAVFLLMLVLLTQTRFGRYVYAIGGNENSAKASGINVRFNRTMVYVISASLVAVAGILLAARTQSGQPAVGTGYESDAIAAVVIGGTSMRGGLGGVGGTLVGAIMIGLINNGLNLLGVSSYYQTVAKGLIILAAVLLDVFSKKAKK